jgi:hypothetical protein
MAVSVPSVIDDDRAPLATVIAELQRRCGADYQVMGAPGHGDRRNAGGASGRRPANVPLDRDLSAGGETHVRSFGIGCSPPSTIARLR